RPLSGCEYATGELPAPSDEPPDAGTRVPKLSLQAPGLTADQRNQPVAASRRGLAAPLSVAVVLPTPPAALVVVSGTPGVVKVRTEPNDVPTEFEAIAQ